MKRVVAGLFAIVCGCSTTDVSRGTPVTIPRSELVSLTATSGQVYELRVALPRGHAELGKSFPVIYVLDADYAFAIVRNALEHLSDRRRVEPAIVVGVAYPEGLEGADWKRRYRVHRTRDYTPVHSKNGYPGGVQDHSGGAATFLDVLLDEIAPLIEARYRSNRDRVLVGHSYGGLFGAYAVLHRPGAFTHAILVSPSLWYADRFLRAYEAERREFARRADLQLFMAAGAHENVKTRGDIAGDVMRLAGTLREAGYPWRVETAVFDAETHDSVFPGGVTRGLLFALGVGAP